MPESETRKAYRREWAKKKYASDPETHRAYAREQHVKHRSKKLSAMAEYREKNKEHIHAQQKEWRDANKPALRRNNLRRIGFTPELFDEMLEHQNGNCAICETDLRALPSKQVHADHCHASGEPRGVLCHHCNSALGLFQDDKTRLSKAASYLETPTMVEMKRRKK